MVRTVLQIEGAAILAASVWVYFFHLEAGWVLFAVLILAPDASMVGFLKDTRLGAVTYNLMHNYVLSAALILAGLVADVKVVMALGLILSAHVGMDRALMYGLKYATGFKDTHMGRV